MNSAKRNAVAIELLVNFLLPWLIYRYTQQHYGETRALILSSIPPLLWSGVELLRFKRVDAVSLMVLVGILLSLGAMALGGDARMLLMRESLASGAVGLAFLLSLLGPRPLLFYLARATEARKAAGADAARRFDDLWQRDPAFAKSMTLMSLVWGLGLLGETGLRAWFAWTWPVERFLLVSPFISYGIYGALAVWTYWYVKRMRARRAPG